MCDNKITLSDVILAAVCLLQEKNGVTTREIAEYVANKRGCDVSQVLTTMKRIMCAAKKNDILIECQGLIRINEIYDDLPKKSNEKKNNDALSLSDDESDSNEEEEEGNGGCRKNGNNNKNKNKKKINPGQTFKLSKTSLEDDEDDDQCPTNSKKRKCR